MIKKSLIAVMATIAIVIIIVAATKNLLPVLEQNLWTAGKNNSVVAPNDQSQEVMTKEDKTFPMYEPVAAYDMLFTVNSYQVTKIRGDFPMPPQWSGLEFDSNGNFTNEYSYFITNISITNPTDAPITFWLNDFNLHFTDQNKNSLPAGGEIHLTNINPESVLEKNYFEYSFKPNHTETINVVAFVKDPYLGESQSIELEINSSGHTMVPHNKERYITLK